MNQRKSTSGPVSRRNFLKLPGLGGGAAAVTLAMDSEKIAAAESAARSRKAGYAESAHVRAYRASTRI
jgi:hypothetical protein